jgi:hypothetical protein
MQPHMQMQPMLDANGQQMIDANGQPMYIQPQMGMQHQGGQQDAAMQMQMQQMQMQMQQMQGQNQAMMNAQHEASRYFSVQEKLEGMNPGVIVKQKFEIMEALSGCEFPNIYYVYGIKGNADEKGRYKKGKKEFKYSEKSDCYDRFCLTGSCKPFTMKCKNLQKDEDKNQTAMRCKKDCKCTYYCWNRPTMECFLDETGVESFLGTCYDACDLYNYNYHLKTDQNEVEYYIKASCCQWYFWCGCCPCNACQTVKFYVTEPGSSEPCSELTRNGRDCMKNAVMGNDADEFTVLFPSKANWRQRAMMMNLCVFIDYSMFEDTSDQDKNAGL